MEAIRLEAGGIYALAIYPFRDGSRDLAAEVLGVSPQEGPVLTGDGPVRLDLSEATPGSQVNVTLAVSIRYSDGAVQTVNVAGTFDVLEPKPATVEPVAPAPADPPAPEPTPEYEAMNHVYTATLGFEETPVQTEDAPEAA